MTDKREGDALYFDEDMGDPVIHRLPGGEAVVFTSRSPAKETSNEDAAGILTAAGSASVLVVADGMGGQRSGKAASELAVKELRRWAGRTRGEDLSVRAAVLNGIEEASRKIIELGVGAGTTVAAVEVGDGIMRPYHVGDSIILVTGQRGQLKLVSVMHSPTGFAMEAGVLGEEEAMHHVDRHIVLNAVGSAEMRIEVGATMRLAARDTVLLASDGLLDNLTVEETVQCIRKGPLVDGIRKLAAIVRERMTESREGQPSKPDDLTLIAYRRDGRGAAGGGKE